MRDSVRYLDDRVPRFLENLVELLPARQIGWNILGPGPDLDTQ